MFNNSSNTTTYTIHRTLVVTAYCLKCSTCGTIGRTSTGRTSKFGAAVNPKNPAVPLNTLLKIPGYGLVRVDDVGGGVNSNQVDLRFTNHKKAIRWGRKVLRISIVMPKNPKKRPKIRKHKR